MSPLVTAYRNGREAALEKFAATRAMREIAKSVAAGTPQGMARANMIARAPGVITSPMGSGIKTLGGGAEGLATLVAHPQHGVAVRKMFDPNARGYAPELIQRKEQLGSLPGAAGHFGATKSMHGTPVHFNEFVQGESVPRLLMTPEQRSASQKAMLQTSRALRQRGYAGRDIRDANIVMTPSGEAKVVDYLPFRPNEVEGAKAQQNVRRMAQSGQMPEHLRDALVTTNEGRALFSGKPTRGFDPTVSSANPAQFNRYMFTGDVTTPRAPTRGPQGTRISTEPMFSPSAPVASGGSPSANAGWSSMLGPSKPSLPASAPTSMLMPAQIPQAGQTAPGFRTPALTPVPTAPPVAVPAAPRATGLSEFL